MAGYELHTHEFEPVFDENSRLLILGSFPSVRSREQSFYYGHPQNRFWKVIASVFDEPVPESLEEKRTFLTRNRVALWDVIESCEIIGSADSSIRNVVPTELGRILAAAEIEAVFLNGMTAFKLFERYQTSRVNVPYSKLPSTSPANAAWSLDSLTVEWKRLIWASISK